MKDGEELVNEDREINDEITDGDEFALEALESKHTSRVSGKAAEVSITRGLGNGNRVALSPKLIEAVGAREVVHIAVYRDGIAIGATLPGHDNPFTLHKSGNKYMVYSRPLAEELVTRFDLDFGSAKTTVSFYEVIYRYGIAYVPLKG